MHKKVTTLVLAVLALFAMAAVPALAIDANAPVGVDLAANTLVITGADGASRLLSSEDIGVNVDGFNPADTIKATERLTCTLGSCRSGSKRFRIRP